MHNRLALACGVAAFTLAIPVALSQQTDVTRDLIGTWAWTMDNNCTETYTFSGDGTLEVKSGDEITKNSFRLSNKSGQFERYRMDVTVLEDSGGRDCDNESKVNVGETDTMFVQLSKSKDMLMMCQNLTTTFCFGPLRKANP
jgi:hypothetical protein